MDAGTPMGKAMRSMLAVFAQLERDMGGERTAEALAVKREQGVILGRRATVGEDVRASIRDMRVEGLSWPAIADRLNAAGIPSGQGGKWWPMTCKRIAESDITRV
jgi:DNA invertase Pin-like site-specific DNA recombinase